MIPLLLAAVPLAALAVNAWASRRPSAPAPARPQLSQLVLDEVTEITGLLDAWGQLAGQAMPYDVVQLDDSAVVVIQAADPAGLAELLLQHPTGADYIVAYTAAGQVHVYSDPQADPDAVSIVVDTETLDPIAELAA